MPPALFAKGGVNLPGTPFAVISRKVSSPTTARYTGLASEIAAPFLPSSPWQAAQFALYRVPKSSTSLGRTTSGPGPGRPGMRLHPTSASPAVAKTRALNEANRGQENLMGPCPLHLPAIRLPHERQMAVTETAASAPSPGDS